METKTDQRGKKQFDMLDVLVQTSSLTTRCGTVPPVLNQKIATSSLASSSSAAAVATPKVERKMEIKTNQRGKQHFDMSVVLVTKKPSGIVLYFISHPNGLVLRVLKNSYNPALLETKMILGPRFIWHPNGIVL